MIDKKKYIRSTTRTNINKNMMDKKENTLDKKCSADMPKTSTNLQLDADNKNSKQIPQS